jgi:hypothetical protein
VSSLPSRQTRLRFIGFRAVLLWEDPVPSGSMFGTS